MPDQDLPPIRYDDLIEKLSDPDTDLDLYMKYMVEVPIPGKMGPDLHPNPDLVTDIPPGTEGGVLVRLANGFMRKRRHQAYRRRLKKGWSGPRFVSEGDSWFQYPTSLKDIIDHLMVKNAILSLGAAGDELSDIRQQREILLNIDAEGASALLLSAGGNDLFDNGQLGRLIEEPFAGASGAELVGPTFDAFLQKMVVKYLKLFRRVHTAFPHVHILIHGYGPAFPRGGSWIEKPLTKRGVPPDTQHEVVIEILKRFNNALARMAARPEFHGKLVHIDVTDIGTDPGDWHDEIHLNGKNYRKVADRFQKVLDDRMNAPSPEISIMSMSTPAPVLAQAVQMSALDQQTLLRELDLRVRLAELDPSSAGDTEMPLLFPDRAETEIGISSIRRATRKLIERWLDDLREVVCGGAEPDNFLEKAIVEALENGKEALTVAVSSWLVTGPFGVPAAIAGALAAWLAGEVLEMGKGAFCRTFVPVAPPVVGAATEASIPTMAEAREKFRKLDGLPTFDRDFQKEELEFLRETVTKDVVEAPTVPVDDSVTEHFMKWAGSILEMLGGEEAEAPAGSSFFGEAEAIVLLDGTRPALYVQDDTIDVNDIKLERSGLKPHVVENLEAIQHQIKATGRIIRGTDRSADTVYGSAWMLEDGRVATAKHVLEFMGVPLGSNWFLNDVYSVDFAVEAERGVSPDKVFRIQGVDFASPDVIAGQVDPPQLDVATLRLEPRDGIAFPEPVPLATDGEVLLKDERPLFFNVGHPGQPFGSWLVENEDDNPKTVSKTVLFALIGDRFGVKRFSAGMIFAKPGAFTSLGGRADSVFLHDATTLGGSSGSPLMMQEEGGKWVTAGLHFAGQFGTRNYAHFVPDVLDALT